jgi:hypothetical protein
MSYEVPASWGGKWVEGDERSEKTKKQNPSQKTKNVAFCCSLLSSFPSLHFFLMFVSWFFPPVFYLIFSF